MNFKRLYLKPFGVSMLQSITIYPHFPIIPNDSRPLTEWGVKQRLVRREETAVSVAVLEACFRGIAMGGKELDAGPSKADKWLTPGARDWFMSSAKEGASKVL